MAFIALLVHCGWFVKTEADLLQKRDSEYVKCHGLHNDIDGFVRCNSDSHIHIINL